MSMGGCGVGGRRGAICAYGNKAGAVADGGESRESTSVGVAWSATQRRKKTAMKRVNIPLRARRILGEPSRVAVSSTSQLYLDPSMGVRFSLQAQCQGEGVFQLAYQ